MNFVAMAAVAIGIALLAGSKKTVKVDIGPAKIRNPRPGKVKVKIGPAVIHHAPKVPRSAPVRVHAPAHHSEATPITVNAARHAGIPIPNLAQARANAQSVADMVRTRRKKYDHARVKAWQLLAGIPADGVYGPKTARALRALGAKSVVDNV